MNLNKILPVIQSNALITKFFPFFIFKEKMKNIINNFSWKFDINKSDLLGHFIDSEYNKDGDSYLSPWSNKYFPQKD